MFRNTYQVDIFYSNKFVPKKYASYEARPEQREYPYLIPNLDMRAEQLQDPEIQKVVAELKAGVTKKKNKFHTDNGVLYRVSDPEVDPIMMFYVPKKLRETLITQYRDLNGHFGVDKCYNTLARSYYWPNMFKELLNYISACFQYNTRNLQRVQPML